MSIKWRKTFREKAEIRPDQLPRTDHGNKWYSELKKLIDKPK